VEVVVTVSDVDTEETAVSENKESSKFDLVELTSLARSAGALLTTTNM